MEGEARPHRKLAVEVVTDVHRLVKFVVVVPLVGAIHEFILRLSRLVNSENEVLLVEDTGKVSRCSCQPDVIARLRLPSLFLEITRNTKHKTVTHKHIYVL